MFFTNCMLGQIQILTELFSMFCPFCMALVKFNKRSKNTNFYSFLRLPNTFDLPLEALNLTYLCCCLFHTIVRQDVNNWKEIDESLVNIGVRHPSRGNCVDVLKSKNLLELCKYLEKQEFITYPQLNRSITLSGSIVALTIDEAFLCARPSSRDWGEQNCGLIQR